MAGRSFEITNAQEFYQKLLEDYKAFVEDSTSSRLAINCAMSAWHLSEWLYWQYNTTLVGTYSKDRDYLEDLRTTLCPDLDIMRGITNGSKHCVPPSNAQRVQGTGLHQGAFGPEFSNDFDVSYLTVTLDNGSVIVYKDALDNVMAFWRAYLVSQFGWTL